MNLTRQQQQSSDLHNSLIAKAWEDPKFKAGLIANPAATIESFSGGKLNMPEGVNIVVTDFSEADYNYIVIPAQPEMDELELTEEQLESIAGGGSPAYVVAIGLFRLGAYLHESWNH